jgi:hypothetical protein
MPEYIAIYTFPDTVELHSGKGVMFKWDSKNEAEYPFKALTDKEALRLAREEIDSLAEAISEAPQQVKLEGLVCLREVNISPEKSSK